MGGGGGELGGGAEGGVVASLHCARGGEVAGENLGGRGGLALLRPGWSSEEQGFTRQTRRLQNEPKNSPIRQEMTEIWSKYCFDHISVISCLIGLFLGLF
jgi:hypothetical protein